MHFISIASGHYSPASHQKMWYDLDLDYLWPPHQEEPYHLEKSCWCLHPIVLITPRPIYIWSLWKHPSHYYVWQKEVLPTCKFKAHAHLHILGLSFLVEVGTIYIDVSMYKKLVMSIDTMIPYIIHVQQLTDFEYQLWVLVSPNTFFFAEVN